MLKVLDGKAADFMVLINLFRINDLDSVPYTPVI